MSELLSFVPSRDYRRWLIALCLAAALSAGTMVALGGSALSGPSGGVVGSGAGQPHSALGEIAAAHPSKQVEVVVQLAAGADAASGRELIRNAGGEVTRNLPIINGLGARLDAASAQRLGWSPKVDAISLNAKVQSEDDDDDLDDRLVTAYPRAVDADEAWDEDYTGRGVGVAVIDTGIQGDLPDFRESRSNATSRVVATAVVNPGASSANDTSGHGTHVAGLIAGDGTARPNGDPLRGRYVGVAPDAHLIAVKVADDQGDASVLDVIDGLQFVVDHKDTHDIDVVNLSLRSTQAESYLTDPLDAAVEAAWNAGIVVVVAAGNDGTDADAVSYAPANDPYVITVGGLDDMGTRSSSDDRLASWSSRGITQDGVTKPDVLAPGARMVSTIPAGSAYTQLCPSCVTDGQYFQVGGTSMAAAVVSGAAADLIQAHPTWTPDQIKTQLTKRTRAVYEPKKTLVGGTVALEKAIEYSLPRSSVNAGLTPNTLIDPATGQIDYTRASWSRASWSDAIDSLRASWSRASWSRASWSRASWSASAESCAEFERASWSRASWSRASWSRASWSRASWSSDGMSAAELSSDDYSQIDAEIASAQAECSALLSEVDPTRASWSRASWSRASWSTSFNK